MTDTQNEIVVPPLPESATYGVKVKILVFEQNEENPELFAGMVKIGTAQCRNRMFNWAWDMLKYNQPMLNMDKDDSIDRIFRAKVRAIVREAFTKLVNAKTLAAIPRQQWLTTTIERELFGADDF